MSFESISKALVACGPQLCGYCWVKRFQVRSTAAYQWCRVRGTGVYQLYRQIQRAHVQNIFYNYLLYPKYSIGGARPHEAGTLPPMSQLS